MTLDNDFNDLNCMLYSKQTGAIGTLQSIQEAKLKRKKCVSLPTQTDDNEKDESLSYLSKGSNTSLLAYLYDQKKNSKQSYEYHP